MPVTRQTLPRTRIGKVRRTGAPLSAAVAAWAARKPSRYRRIGIGRPRRIDTMAAAAATSELGIQNAAAKSAAVQPAATANRRKYGDTRAAAERELDITG